MKGPWPETLRREKAAGLHACRVRILSPDLTSYERYACEFGYAYNVPAGEDVRVLHRGEHSVPEDVIENDYWLVDDTDVVVMHYDEQGRFEAAECLPESKVTQYVEARNTAWAAAEPFLTWWKGHLEYQRRPVA